MALAGVLGLFSNLSRLPKSSYQRLLYVLPIPLVLVLCGSGPVLPISQQSPDVSAADLRWADFQLHGYQIDEGSQSLAAHLFLSPSGWAFDGLGYSITLIDQSSHEVYAKQDAFANKSLNFLLAPGYNTVWRQWLRLDIPPAVPANRAMWVVLTLWRAADGDFVSQPILSSCIVSDYNGVLSYSQKDALWDRYFTLAPQRLRQPAELYKIVKRA